MESSEVVLAIDIGTTNNKLALFDSSGHLIWKDQHRCDISNTDGCHEADPESWWETICRSVSGIETNLRKRVFAISVIAQGPTIVPVNRSGKPLGQAITWMDQRGSEYLDEALRAEPDRQLARVLCKLIDLSRNALESTVLLQPADFVNLKLTGTIANASFSAPGFLPWRTDSLSALGLDRCFEVPKLIESGNAIGKLRRSVSSETGLPNDVVVVAGSPDFAAALVGTNTVREGDLCDRGGTSQGITLCSKARVEIQGLLTTPYFLKNHWKISGLMSTTGKSLEWFQNKVVEKTISEKDLKIDRPTRIVFLPYLNGERSPYWDNDARGMFFGLDLESDSRSLAVSVMEGVAYGMAQIMARMESAKCSIERVRTTGGQALSRVWNEIKSDVVGKPIEVPEITESELLGAAMYAISHLQGRPIVEVSNSLFRISYTVEPNTAKHRVYKEIQLIYDSLYEANAGLFHKLFAISDSSSGRIFDKG